MNNIWAFLPMEDSSHLLGEPVALRTRMDEEGYLLLRGVLDPDPLHRLRRRLVDIMAAVVSMIAMVAFLRFWQPKKIWRFDYDDKPAAQQKPAAEISDQMGGEWSAQEFDGYAKPQVHTAGQVMKAWMPFAVLSLFVLIWGLPSIKLAMNRATTPAFQVVLPDGKKRPGPPGWDVPYLHNAIFRADVVYNLFSQYSNPVQSYGPGTTVDLTPLLPLAANPATLVNALYLTLTHGVMPAAMKTDIINAVTADAPSGALHQVQTGCYLILTSSYYNVWH